MTSHEIRKAFLDFFASKQHKIVPSAPLVNKNDPTLLFTNSGMAPFKDFFLGNREPSSKRIADTQKCLRVSGKHNDLEDVGYDGTHHTMFEMLGNWSFGDYFKQEAIAWSWELLTEVYKLPKDRLYATVFGGDAAENLAADDEAKQFWLQYLPENQILYGNKKDNFWEMGEVGPCGPCSEIHIDLRDDAARAAVPGETLVNTDDPLVVEIWNNVFMQFERKADRSLVVLPAQHVDTGMGFERLCMVLQGVDKTYDTDVFRPAIAYIEKASGFTYKGSYERDAKSDIAMRVMVDHIRAVAFVIADGQLPSNTGAGYVIRRILRRAVRYAFSFLNMKEPFMYRLVGLLADQMKDAFPELYSQKEFVSKVVLEEEKSFLRTLETGLQHLEQSIRKEQILKFKQKNPETKNKKKNIGHKDIKVKYFFLKNGITHGTNFDNKNISDQDINALRILDIKYLKLDELSLPNDITLDGPVAFELFDTYGFPIDLTELIMAEKGFKVDEIGFKAALQEQKDRSRKATARTVGDWSEIAEGEVKFVGYDLLEVENAQVLKFRTVENKGKTEYQVVLSVTPFYPEGGGQIGDTGLLYFGDEPVQVLDTKKENDLIIHFVAKLPQNIEAPVRAVVDAHRRSLTENNHSATHLVQAALSQVLGDHIAQKGSLNNADYLRFDFSHFQKVSDEELLKVENIVNQKIRQNIALQVFPDLPIAEAAARGARMLFGEKYGEKVRMIVFDDTFSKELCGGTHVPSTGKIGLFKFTTETAVAAGVRRIEAVTAEKAEEYMNNKLAELDAIKAALKNPADVVGAIGSLQEENRGLKKQLEQLFVLQARLAKSDILASKEQVNGIAFVSGIVEIGSVEALKNLAHDLRKEPNSLVAIGAAIDGKAHIAVAFSDELQATRKDLAAGALVKLASPHIKGGGGGQPFFATAGGTESSGLGTAIAAVKAAL